MSGEIEATARGFLGADVVVKSLPQGDVAELRLAVGVQHKDTAGVYQDVRTDWLDVSAWNGLASAVAHLKKGDLVEVRGPLTPRAYIAKTGEALSSDKITARSVTVVPRAPKSETPAK